MRNSSGYSLPEVLIALLLTLVVTMVALALVDIAQRQSATMPAGSDVQQRARVAADTLLRAIRNAGAGYDGGPQRGSLARYLPVVLPRRLGPIAPDPSQLARADALTLISILDSTVQTTTTAEVGTGGLLSLSTGPGCSASRPMCGAAPGAGLLFFDAAGNFDLFRLVDLNGTLAPRTASGHVFPPGTAAAGVSSRTYYFDAPNRQLREYDDDRTDAPLVDNVTDFTVEYLGVTTPPMEPRPPVGAENCLYASDGTSKPMPVMSATDGALAALPLSVLSDGPWCGSGETQFDADLLRVRALRLTIRVQGGSQSVTGTWRAVPDLTLSFVVSPRNLRS